MKTKAVLSALGNVQKVCNLLNCTRSAIYQWGEEVPENRQYELEVKTGGLLKSDFTLLIEKDASERGKE